MSTDHAPRPPEQLLINEVQLLLAEQRTYYALLRTGIAIFTLPLSLVGFLLATAGYHRLFANSFLAFVVILLLGIISLAGLKLLIGARKKLKKIEEFIAAIKHENKRLAEIII